MSPEESSAGSQFYSSVDLLSVHGLRLQGPCRVVVTQHGAHVAHNVYSCTLYRESAVTLTLRRIVHLGFIVWAVGAFDGGLTWKGPAVTRVFRFGKLSVG